MQLYFAPIFPKTLQVRMERNLIVFSGDLICHFDFCAHANICDFQLSQGLKFSFLPEILSGDLICFPCFLRSTYIWFSSDRRPRLCILEEKVGVCEIRLLSWYLHWCKRCDVPLSDGSNFACPKIIRFLGDLIHSLTFAHTQRWFDFEVTNVIIFSHTVLWDDEWMRWCVKTFEFLFYILLLL